jgi:hypothetical protein
MVRSGDWPEKRREGNTEGDNEQCEAEVVVVGGGDEIERVH